MKINHFSYPYGTKDDVGKREFEIVEELGFRSAVTTSVGELSKKTLFNLPRIHINQKVGEKVLKLKQWNGKPFNGTLFVHGEQGVGDLIIHSSMIADLYEIHQDICLTVEERLLSLFKRSFNYINVIAYDSNLKFI